MSVCAPLRQTRSSREEETTMELRAAETHRAVEWFGLEGASSRSIPLPWAGHAVLSVPCSCSIQTASSDGKLACTLGWGKLASLLPELVSQNRGLARLERATLGHLARAPESSRVIPEHMHGTGLHLEALEYPVRETP